LGAHAEYSSNYITENVKALYDHEVDNVGGVVEQIWPIKNLVGKAITKVLSSKFGIGGASYRTGTDKPLLVTTVFGTDMSRSEHSKNPFLSRRMSVVWNSIGAVLKLKLHFQKSYIAIPHMSLILERMSEIVFADKRTWRRRTRWLFQPDQKLIAEE